MCGIFAYLGDKKTAGKLVVEGLKKLEYRGYDSFGIAEKLPNKFQIIKKVGKISDFDPNKAKLASTNLAIGHTRWATHGGVTKLNAHPHLSSNGKIAVVHNGIVENHDALRKALQKKGVKFISQTDTEVIPNLIAAELEKNDFPTAVRKAAKKIKGRYSFVALKHDEETLVAARNGSPLIVGVEKFYPKNDGERHGKADGSAFFIASDVPAFLAYTSDVSYLDDEQMVVITRSPLGDHFHGRFFNLNTGEAVPKRIVSIELAAGKAEKGSFEHFMLKEIFEQKETIAKALNQDEKQLKLVAQMIKKAYGSFFIGCGTAGKVCAAAEYLFASIAKKHINVIFGSEFDTQEAFLTPKTLLVAVSQSGETADVLEAYKIAKKKKVKTVGVVNVAGSSIARSSDVILPVNAGVEKAVASTKATTAQLAILTLLAYTVAGKLEEGKRVLAEAASQINDFLNPRYSAHLKTIAEKIKNVESMYVIGKGADFPMALEAAIKLQEVSYIHAEGFAAGELKHGPLALIEKNTPLIAFVPAERFRHDVLSNVAEVKARGGMIIGVSPKNDALFDEWIRVPNVDTAQPIVNIIPIQLLAYHLAVLRKNNPDLPRNLAKSVTVK
ncbi:MAG: glutamine--fructose-6-phosphate transaminase (isomerizing) [Candidatus Gracilibacteria bacterium]|nr:glutamine--fructose-6-phosphate transaminase (isomerizing) [Candidatus Gracilibacteria bacterium]MDD5179104.1 glutamine--fructose-6-phosphate transaminase (isomerizing) [Candidatus Gracilibacteria bacterium]